MSSRESKELCSELEKIELKFAQFENKLENNLNQSSQILTEIQDISNKFKTALKLLTDNHPMYETNNQPIPDEKELENKKLSSISVSTKTATLDIKNSPTIIMIALNNGKIAIGTLSGEYRSFRINPSNGQIEDLYKKDIPETKIIDMLNYDDTHLLIVSNDFYVYLWEHTNGKLSDVPKTFDIKDYIYGIALLDKSNFVCCNETFIRYYSIIDNKLGDKKEFKTDISCSTFTCEAIVKVTNKMSNDNDAYKIVVSIKYSNRQEDDGQLIILNENKKKKTNVPGVFVTAACYKGMAEIPKWNYLAVAFVKYHGSVVRENKIILLDLMKFEKQKEIDLGSNEIKSLCRFVRFKDNMFFISNGVLTQFFENGDNKQFKETSTQLQGHGCEFIENGKYFICPYHEETRLGRVTNHKFGISIFTTSFA